MSFTLHPTLNADTSFVSDLPLCTCLLMNDSRYSWLILVPRVADTTEVFQLTQQQQQQLMLETSAISKLLHTHTKADKINIGALGNMVAQLHIHIIARFKSDEAWPKPVWGLGTSQPFTEEAKSVVITELQQAISALTL